jgi:cell division protein FtsB
MVVRRRLRSVLVPLVLYCAAGYCVWFFLESAKGGERGLAAKQILKIQVYEANRELDGVRAEHAEWDHRLALLRADQVDRDLLEERARTVLGRVHKNDLVIVTAPD